MQKLVRFSLPEVIFGDGARFGAVHALKALAVERPLLVTDAGLIAAGWVEELSQYLQHHGVPVTIWSAVTPNPKDHEVMAGARQYLLEDCDGLIALGGGSVIDAAKGIGLLASHGGDLHDYVGIGRTREPLPPLIAIPTTAGSGADISQYCVITDTSARCKMVMADKNLIPDMSLIDPETLRTLSPAQAAQSGFDVITHAVEAYLSIGANVLTDSPALEALELANAHLERFARDPTDAEAGRGMALACLKAAVAFSNAGLGLAHALAHQIGGTTDLPHGCVIIWLLPSLLRRYAVAAPERTERVARALAPSDAGDRAVEGAVRRLEALRAALDCLSPTDVPRPELEILHRWAEGARHDVCFLTSPWKPNAEELVALLQECWSCVGDP